MADDVRVSAAGAYVRLDPPDRPVVTAIGAYVKRRLYTDEMRASSTAAYVKLLVPFVTALEYYAVGAGHNLGALALTAIDPQPAHGFVRVTRRHHSLNRKVQDDALYVILEYSTLEDGAAYRDLLGQFGLLTAKEADITLNCRDQAYRWKRYNGVACQPVLGTDGEWQAYFPRGFGILVKELEEL